MMKMKKKKRMRLAVSCLLDHWEEYKAQARWGANVLIRVEMELGIAVCIIVLLYWSGRTLSNMVAGRDVVVMLAIMYYV